MHELLAAEAEEPRVDLVVVLAELGAQAPHGAGRVGELHGDARHGDLAELRVWQGAVARWRFPTRAGTFPVTAWMVGQPPRIEKTASWAETSTACPRPVRARAASAASTPIAPKSPWR